MDIKVVEKLIDKMISIVGTESKRKHISKVAYQKTQKLYKHSSMVDKGIVIIGYCEEVYWLMNW